MHLCAVVATNNVRLSRRDQEQSPPGKTKKHLAAASSTSQVTPPPLATKTQLNYNTTSRRRMTSMEPKKVRNERKTCNYITQVGSPAVRLRLARCTAWVKRWSEAMDFLLEKSTEIHANYYPVLRFKSDAKIHRNSRKIMTLY